VFSFHCRKVSYLLHKLINYGMSSIQLTSSSGENKDVIVQLSSILIQ